MLAKFIDRPREDSLTASVFGHLLHLPSEVFWTILKNACPSPAFPAYPGEPLAIHAWPNWNGAGTRNSVRVIPDLVMEFEAFDLIVEAKRWDIPMQDEEQWEAELKAYLNEYGSRRRSVKMLALGGIHFQNDEQLLDSWKADSASNLKQIQFICPVHMCQWSSLLLACQRQKRQLELGDHTSRTLADLRILNDLTALFIRHGITPLKWFDDFSFSPNLLSPTEESERGLFRNLGLQFRKS